MGEVDGPHSELKTCREFEDDKRKLPYVKREYGVVNPQSGKVIEVECLDYAKKMVGYMHSMIVFRSVSEWLVLTDE